MRGCAGLFMLRNIVSNVLRQLSRLRSLTMTCEIAVNLALNRDAYCKVLRIISMNRIVVMPQLTRLEIRNANSNFIETVMAMLRCPILKVLFVIPVEASVDRIEKPNLGPLLKSCQTTIWMCTLKCGFVISSDDSDGSNSINSSNDEDESKNSSKMHFPNMMTLQLLIGTTGDMADLTIPSCAPGLRRVSFTAKVWSPSILRMLCVTLPPTLRALDLKHPGLVEPNWSQEELQCFPTLRRMLPHLERHKKMCGQTALFGLVAPLLT